jgi:hypothetical protein
MANFLVSRGADRRVKNKAGLTPDQLASTPGFVFKLAFPFYAEDESLPPEYCGLYIGRPL